MLKITNIIYMALALITLTIVGNGIIVITGHFNPVYHKYAENDCFQYNGEVWENKPICKVVQVGRAKYLYKCPTNFILTEQEFDKEDNAFNLIDTTTLGVDCPVGY